MRARSGEFVLIKNLLVAGVTAPDVVSENDAVVLLIVFVEVAVKLEAVEKVDACEEVGADLVGPLGEAMVELDSGTLTV